MENIVYHTAFETGWDHYSMYFFRYSLMKVKKITHRIGPRPNAKTLTNRG
jgi:hypothetical protein